jgi:hypothetical protein
MQFSVRQKVAEVWGTAVADDESAIAERCVVEIHKLERLAKRGLGDDVLPGSPNSARRRVLWMVSELKKPISRGGAPDQRQERRRAGELGGGQGLWQTEGAE